MTNPGGYENYPFRIVVWSNLVSLVVYGLGALIMFRLGWIWLALYLAYCLYVETRLMRKSCVHCYYYGKICAFGRGWLCARFLKRGDPQTFITTRITWAKMIPDFLVFLLPLGTGVVFLTLAFDWMLLSLLIVLVVVAMSGNAMVRKRLACYYCKQKELGCPALELFRTTKPAEPGSSA